MRGWLPRETTGASRSHGAARPLSSRDRPRDLPVPVASLSPRPATVAQVPTLTFAGAKPEADREQEAHMFHHAGRHDIAHDVELVLRANRAAILFLLWGALGACVVGSLVLDIGHLLGCW